MGKGENAGYQPFFLFPLCFLKALLLYMWVIMETTTIKLYRIFNTNKD